MTTENPVGGRGTRALKVKQKSGSPDPTEKSTMAGHDRWTWPSAVEMHFMFYNKRIPFQVMEELNKAWIFRHGNAPATSLELWRVACEDVLKPETPFDVHQALFELCYVDWDAKKLGPAPVWVPAKEEARKARAIKLVANLQSHFEGPGTNVDTCALRDLAESYARLQKFSVRNQEVFWSSCLRELGVRFRQSPNSMFYPRGGAHAGQEQWFPGAIMNVADTCFSNKSLGSPEEQTALVWAREGEDDTILGDEIRTWTYADLLERSSRIANCFKCVGVGKGSRVGICMPMTAESVAIYLAVVMAGGAVVGIADSFSRHEIHTRLRVSEADAVVTQDLLFRGNKHLTLYERVAGAAEDYKEETGKSVQVVCLPAKIPSGFSPESGPAPALGCKLRPTDLPYTSLLGLSSSAEFVAVGCHPQDVTNVLFSSGTTGEPKAIPWDHVAPIKAAADAMLHHDVSSADVVCWPTNLGWMMGPWLLYAGLVNGACVAIFEGSPLGKAFCHFVEQAGVTMLGTVPSIVKAWKAKNAVAGSDWSRVKRFSSSGEASNATDYHWLSSRVNGYAPVIEYIGGTELAGGYMSGSLVQPQAASHFSVPAFGADLRLLDAGGAEMTLAEMAEAMAREGECQGEVAIVPPMIGSSYKLLNRNHDQVYFSGMPSTRKEGIRMRKHGDMLSFRPGGYIQAKGRTDDTMNLGGIKTSSLEIETVCNSAVASLGLPVKEVAAVAVQPRGGGPDLLYICAAVKGDLGGGSQVGRGSGEWKKGFQRAIAKNLNPLFKVHEVVLIKDLPRTASNKIMRKALQAQCGAQAIKSKL